MLLHTGKPLCFCLPSLSLGVGHGQAAKSIDKKAAAETVRMDVAQIVAGLNAHDAAKTTAYDAPDVISMECGSPSAVGIDADREGFQTGFAHDPRWRVSLIAETVDVASSGDLARIGSGRDRLPGSSGAGNPPQESSGQPP